MMKRRSSSRAFTLLEVLVAIAILGLGLVVILSSQAGLFSSASRGAHLTVASNLVRCKMSEIELMLEQKGFSLTDENDEGDCCEDESDGYTCSWKIERVELPPLPEAAAEEGGAAGPAGSAGLKGPGDLALGTPPGGDAAAAGPLGALMGIAATQGASLGDKATPGSVMQQLGSTGASGMEGMVMGFVYPSLKPMLEASIRRVTVKVKWTEGQRARDLEVTQFVTRPQEGELGTSEMLGLDQLSGAVDGMQSNPGNTGNTGKSGGNTGRTGDTGRLLK
jgi:general secretion pathway protein I